jgi:hypothetical protein
MKGDREMCLAAGMDDYVASRWTCRILRAAIDRVCAVPGRCAGIASDVAVDCQARA